MQKFENLDAAQTAFFTRELEHIKAKTYDIVYPAYKATKMIPVSSEAGPGAESITYRQFDRVGLMKIISDYADDLPRSDVKGVEFTTPVRSIGGSYGYSVQDIRSAEKAGRPLPARKAAAVRQAYEQKVNKIGWKGDGSTAYGGLYGLIYQPNVTVAAAPTGSWTGGVTTPDQIIADVTKSVEQIRDLTLGVEEPDTILLPNSQYTHIATTPRSANVDTTILEFLKKVFPGITFDWVNELKNVNPKPSDGSAANTNIMITYSRNPDKLTYEIPQGFEQFAPQTRNLEFVVPAHGRNGGVIVYYPLSIYITEGL